MVGAHVHASSRALHVLQCAGDGPRGVETCQRVYADTPFRYNWRHTYSSCCERLTYCTHRRLHHRRIPNNCFKWLPMVADPGDDVAKAKRDPLINASLSSKLDAVMRALQTNGAQAKPKRGP